MQTSQVLHESLTAECARRGLRQPDIASLPVRRADERLAAYIVRCRAAYALPDRPADGSHEVSSTLTYSETLRAELEHAQQHLLGGLKDGPLEKGDPDGFTVVIIGDPAQLEPFPGARAAVEAVMAKHSKGLQAFTDAGITAMAQEAATAKPVNAGADHAGAGDRAVSSIAAKAFQCPTCDAAPDADCKRSGNYRRGSHRARMALLVPPADPGIKCTARGVLNGKEMASTFAQTALATCGLCIGLDPESDAARMMRHRNLFAPMSQAALFDRTVARRMIIARDALPLGASLAARSVFEAAVNAEVENGVERMKDAIGKALDKVIEKLPDADTHAEACKAAEAIDRTGITCTDLHRSEAGTTRLFGPTTHHLTGPYIGIARGSAAEKALSKAFYEAPIGPDATFARRVGNRMDADAAKLNCGGRLRPRWQYESEQRQIDAEAAKQAPAPAHHHALAIEVRPNPNEAVDVRTAAELESLLPVIERLCLAHHEGRTYDMAARKALFELAEGVVGNLQPYHYSPATLPAVAAGKARHLLHADSTALLPFAYIDLPA